ncbi:hypothetical protein M407DRAFT_28266 [Tulasnella calospora MUT 4182]|uniref:Uncharacterized protein n=1 Tax=Tulasnella calospora MUT 4182 TaxID=1051891 RepID=A0A0C3QAZ9_9AGAM|nr:hypothetical protein M407DRAFT_28266 [Tulasnella calospora MUT 4182]
MALAPLGFTLYPSVESCRVQSHRHHPSPRGRTSLTKGNNLHSKFDLNGIPAASPGVHQIKVSFEIDANGILKIGAVEGTSGRSESIQIINSKDRLSEDHHHTLQKPSHRFDATTDGIMSKHGPTQTFSHSLRERFKAGDVCTSGTSEARVVSIINSHGGKSVKVKEDLLRDGELVIEVTSSFLNRGSVSDSHKHLRIVNQVHYAVDIKSRADIVVLEDKGMSLPPVKFLSATYNCDVTFIDMVLPGDCSEGKLKHAGMNNGKEAILVRTVSQSGEKVIMGIAEVTQAPTGQGYQEPRTGTELNNSSPAARAA